MIKDPPIGTGLNKVFEAFQRGDHGRAARSHCLQRCQPKTLTALCQGWINKDRALRVVCVELICFKNWAGPLHALLELSRLRAEIAYIPDPATAVLAWLMAPADGRELPTLEDLLRRPDWHREALCRGQGAAMFVRAPKTDYGRLRAVCGPPGPPIGIAE